MIAIIGWVGFGVRRPFGILMSLAENGKGDPQSLVGACRAVGDSGLGGRLPVVLTRDEVGPVLATGRIHR